MSRGRGWGWKFIWIRCIRQRHILLDRGGRRQGSRKPTLNGFPLLWESRKPIRTEADMNFVFKAKRVSASKRRMSMNSIHPSIQLVVGYKGEVHGARFHVVIMDLKGNRVRFEHRSFELCYDRKWKLVATVSRGLRDLEAQKILSQNRIS